MKNVMYIAGASIVALLLIVWAAGSSEVSSPASQPSLPSPTALPRVITTSPRPTTIIPVRYYQPSRPLYFNGYPCTDDCSGHEAGYEWAEENGIEDVDDCDGNSDSFIEGCQSYVEENYGDDEYEDDYGYEEY